MTMSFFVQRLVRGGRHATTVVTPMEYRVTLRLGDVDLLFVHGAGTPAGRKERLQLLGLLPLPLTHHDCNRFYNYIWAHYVPALFSPPNAPPLAGDALDAKIKEAIEQYIVEGGALPGPDAFAKVRVPGDQRVLHRDFDPGMLAEPEYTLAKGDRSEVERRIVAANPAIGKVPVVAHVEKRPKGSHGAWQDAPNERVYFQLRPPRKLPSVQLPADAGLVAGARSWCKGVTAPPRRSSQGVQTTTMARRRRGGAGPDGYLQRHVYNRKGDPNFAPDSAKDPQAGNAWWELGGKRALTDANTLGTAPNRNGEDHDNVFVLSNLGVFYNTYTDAEATQPAEYKHNAHAVCATTLANGEAGVIFAPSLVGGDRYRLRAYIRTTKGKAEAKTGTMVRWRTVRISRVASVTAPAAPNNLDAKLRNDTSAWWNDCPHSEAAGGRYCGRCLLREGQVPALTFDGSGTVELAKAWCELLVDPNAQQDWHAALPQQALDDVIDEFMRDQEQGRITAGLTQYVDVVGVTDGSNRNFVGQLTPRHSILKKNVRVFFVRGTADPIRVAIDDGQGELIEYGQTSKFAAGGIDLDGEVNYTTGAFRITFASAPPAGGEIRVVTRASVAVDLRTLVYHSAASPFLLNLLLPQRYNTLIDRSRFAPIPTEHSVTDQAVGTSNGTDFSHTGMLAAGIITHSFKMDGAALPEPEYSVRVHTGTGAFEVRRVEPCTEVVPYAPVGNHLTAVHTFADVPQPATAEVFTVKLRDANGDHPFANMRRFDETIRVSDASLAGKAATVTYEPGARRVTVRFGVAPVGVTHLVFEYKKRVKIPAGKVFTASYKCRAVYDDTHPMPAGHGPARPTNDVLDFVAGKNGIISWYLMARLMRGLADSNGRLPGLTLARAPLRDTWSAVWLSKSFHEGKGVCNAFFLFCGNRWRTNGYDAVLEAADSPVEYPARYPSLLIHEMSHCLYLNHFPSGGASGGRADQHDAFDACLMGYGDHNHDYCGQCLAGLMGLRARDARMGTWRGPRGVLSSPPTKTEERNDPNKRLHIEPPTVAQAVDTPDTDDIFSLLMRCPASRKVYKDALAALGWPRPGGLAPQPSTSAGSLLEISGSISGSGAANVWEMTASYTLTNKITLLENQQALPGCAVTTHNNSQVMAVQGPDIGVQVLVMELSNIKHRYDFFRLDADAYRGRVGMQKYIRETERIEYDGGVRNVIAAYNDCGTGVWKARICAKQEAATCANFDDYYRDVLPKSHKLNYEVAWLDGEMRTNWYRKRVPRLADFTTDRVEGVMTLLDRRLCRDAPQPPYTIDLYEDDDAGWNLLQILFAADPDFDVDANEVVLQWAIRVLKSQHKDTPALDRVRAVAAQALTDNYLNAPYVVVVTP